MFDHVFDFVLRKHSILSRGVADSAQASNNPLQYTYKISAYSELVETTLESMFGLQSGCKFGI